MQETKNKNTTQKKLSEIRLFTVDENISNDALTVKNMLLPRKCMLSIVFPACAI